MFKNGTTTYDCVLGGKVRACSRQAHQTGLVDDLLLHESDVLKDQVLAASDRFVTDSVQMAEDVDGHGGGVLEAVLRKKGKFGTSRKELGNIGAAAVADVAGGEGAAATEEGADAAEEGGASRAEQGSDDDFQHVPPGATKGGRAKDAEAPSSNANGKQPMEVSRGQWVLRSWPVSTRWPWLLVPRMLRTCFPPLRLSADSDRSSPLGISSRV